MPSLKDLYPELITDYLDGFDIEGVEVPANVMKKIYEQISPDELTPKKLLNECLAFGILKREEDAILEDWSREEALKKAQEYGRMGRREASVGIQDFWESIQQEANKMWKRKYSLSTSEVAEEIAENMENLLAEDRRAVRTIRGRIKKPKNF